MMRVSGQNYRCLLVSLYVSFTFELQLQSSANVFHVSSYFLTVGFGVYATATL